MRCTRNAALDCRQTELCEIMGCQAGLEPPGISTPAKPAEGPPASSTEERGPSLSWLERKAVALHDRLEGLARKPAPEPPLPPLPSLTVEELLSEIRTVLGPPPPAGGLTESAPPSPAGPPPQFAPPAAATVRGPMNQAPRELKVISVPAGGWVFVEQNAPVAVALDAAGAGQALTTLLATR